MSDGVTIALKGGEQIKQALERAVVEYPKAAAVALYRMGERIMRDALQRVPVNSGELKDSAYVTRPSEGQPHVEIGFGSQHAVPLHERTHVHHPRGEAKFLQKAVDDQVKSFIPTFGAELQAAVKSGASAASGGEFPVTPHTNESRARQASHRDTRRSQLRESIRRKRR